MGKRKTQEQFEQDVFERLGENYELLSPYPGAHGKVLMKHFICGNTFQKNVHDIISKRSGCPYCNGAKPALYNEKWVKDNTPEPYEYRSGYSKMKEKCIFYCKKCNSEFEQSPSRLINEHIYGCNCCPTKKWSNEEFLSQLGETCLNEYEVLEEYITTDTPIRFKHKKCDTTFSLSPYRFIYRHNKKYCPICYYKKSQGEVIITTFLKNNNIDYQKEFIFSDLPQRRFDFFLPEEQIAIEFDGKQHFEYIPFLHNNNIENFYLTQQRDQEKNDFCLLNNIKLFRFSYIDLDNLEEILQQIFKEKSSTTIEKYLVKNMK